MLEERLRQYLLEYEPMMHDLRLVQSLGLPQCYIAAGYIRNYVWDRLHGLGGRGRHHDIDVVYFDPENPSEERDLTLERQLIGQTGNDRWSVKNQARMHIRNREAPYHSTEDALSRWPETVTAVGARLDEEDRLSLCSPHGLDDLFNLVVRRSPLFTDRAYYLRRVHEKEWKKQWPLLTIIED